MSGPKRNPDRLNTIGVVVVGICTAVLVYVTIVALEAFYVSDSSEIQSQQDYGGQEREEIGHKADEIQHLSDTGPNANGTFHIPIEIALKQIAAVAKSPGADLTHLASPIFPSTKATRNIDGSDLKAATPPAPSSGAPPTDGSAAGSGSASPPPMVPTGTGAGTPKAPGAGVPAAATPAGAGSAAPKRRPSP